MGTKKRKKAVKVDAVPARRRSARIAKKSKGKTSKDTRKRSKSKGRGRGRGKSASGLRRSTRISKRKKNDENDENSSNNVPKRGRSRGGGRGRGRGRGKRKTVLSDESDIDEAAVKNLRRSRRIRRQEPEQSVSVTGIDSTDLGESDDSELEALLNEANESALTEKEKESINEASLDDYIDGLLEDDSDDQ